MRYMISLKKKNVVSFLPYFWMKWIESDEFIQLVRF